MVFVYLFIYLFIYLFRSSFFYTHYFLSLFDLPPTTCKLHPLGVESWLLLTTINKYCFSHITYSLQGHLQNWAIFLFIWSSLRKYSETLLDNWISEKIQSYMILIPVLQNCWMNWRAYTHTTASFEWQNYSAHMWFC